MIYAIPVDTCYGIACPIDSKEEYERLYEMKGRVPSKRLPMIVRDFDDLARYSDLTAEQIAFLKEYPHPFTVVAGPGKDWVWPAHLADRSDMALRVAEACMAREIRDTLPFPLYLTSANLSGGKELYSREDVLRVFHTFREHMKAWPGEIGPNPPSNIVRFVGDTLEIEYERRNYPM